jgi:hypothetical protein
LVAGLRAQIATLERQIANLEGEFSGQNGETSGDPSPAWVKPKRSKRTGKPRKKRTSSYGRKRSKPTRQVIHAVETCRQCGCRLKGGSVKRTREVLHIPLVPAEVVEHVFVERRCPLCNLRQTPGAEVLRGEVLGQHRVSLQTMAIITALREEGRLPIGVIQWFLQALYGLELSQGEIVAILHAVAAHGRGCVDEIRQELRTSPVVHGDETGWREDGQNGYFWSFSTPQVSYFEYRHSRAGQVVEDIMGQSSNTAWCLISTGPITVIVGCTSAAGHTCCGISTICEPITPTTRRSRLGARRCMRSIWRPALYARDCAMGTGWRESKQRIASRAS